MFLFRSDGLEIRQSVMVKYNRSMRDVFWGCGRRAVFYLEALIGCMGVPDSYVCFELTSFLMHCFTLIASFKTHTFCFI